MVTTHDNRTPAIIEAELLEARRELQRWQQAFGRYTGNNPNEFTIGNDTCSNQSLAAGLSCTIEARFAPIARGYWNAYLNVHDDLPSGQQAVYSTGQGTGGQVYFNDASFNYTRVGTVGPSQGI